MKASAPIQKISSSIFILIVLLLLTLSAPAQTQPAYDLNAPIPTDTAIRKGVLDNGLTYYIKHNEKPEDRLELRLVVKAGSVLENEDQLGLAHFLEHMAFNGTAKYEKNELVSYLQSLGIKFGADLNAYTSFDETVYILPVPTDTPGTVNKALEILRQWATEISFDSTEIEKERGIVIEEWRRGRGAGQRLRDEYLPLLLKDSRYADRLPIGTLESLQTFEHEDLIAFYNTWYRPELMAVVAVGDMDVDVLEDMIKRHFSSIKPADSAPERPQFDVPAHDSTFIKILSDAEATHTNISIYHKMDAKEEKTLRDYRRSLKYAMFTGMLNKRLRELTEQAVPPFLYAGTGYGPLFGTTDAYVAQAYVNDYAIKTGLRTLIEEQQRVLQYGFTEPELERFKKEIIRSYEKAYNERDKSSSAGYAAEYIRNFLQNEPIPGIAFEYNFVQTQLDDIHLEEVNELSEEIFTPSNRVVVITAPEKEDITLPSGEVVRQVMKEAHTTELLPYQEENTASQLMAPPADTGNIASTKYLEEIDVTEYLLSNGVRVLVKSTDFKNDEVLLSAYSFGGQSLYPDSVYASAAHADGVINESGYGDFSPSLRSKILAGKSAYVRPFIGQLTEGISAGASPKDLEAMFQLIYLAFTQPRRDTALFQAYVNKMMSLNSNLLAQPNYYFSDKVTEIMTQNHPRGGGIPKPEFFQQIELEEALEIYRERFANAADFTFFIVGNVDADSLKPYLNAYLATLPAQGSRETYRDLGIRPPDGVTQKEFYKGNDPKSLVTIRFYGAHNFSRENNYLLSSLSDYLDIRLKEVIREEYSGVYSISARANTSKHPYEHYQLTVSFPCSPDNVDTLLYATLAEIKSSFTNTISEEYVQKVREAQRRTHEVNVKENAYWLGALQSSDMYGFDPLSIGSFYDDRIARLTAEDLQKAATKFLDFSQYATFILKPSQEPSAEAEGDGN